MYEWIMERTADQEVKRYLQGSVGDEYRPIHGFPVRDAIPRSISEISIGAKVPEWWLKGCLRRLERNDIVVRDGAGWKIVQRLRGGFSRSVDNNRLANSDPPQWEGFV